MFKIIALALSISLQGLLALNASASPYDVAGGFVPSSSAPMLQLVADMPVKPSQAALIAQHANPGSTVLKVELQGGEYAVTLRVGNSVQRVMVNATSGQLG